MIKYCCLSAFFCESPQKIIANHPPTTLAPLCQVFSVGQPEPPDMSWTVTTPIKNFFTKEAAQEEANKWNTGRVVEYNIK